MTPWILWMLWALPWNVRGSLAVYGVATQYKIPVSFWPKVKTEVFSAQFLWSRLAFTWEPQWNSIFSAQLSVEAQPMVGDSWSLRYFETSYDESRMHGGDTLWTDTYWGTRLMLYRASLQGNFARMRVRVGRILLTQGLTYMYSPLDFYGPRQRLALDPEFLPGMDALEVTVYPTEDLRIRWVWPADYEDLPSSVSFRFWVGEWEAVLLGTREGVGVAGSHPLWQGILRAEGYRKHGKLYGSLNYDRFFPGDIYVLVELFWPPKGMVSGFTPIQAKETPFAAVLFQKTWNPLWTTYLLWVEALKDRSFLVVPSLQYAIANSATLEFRADLAWGEAGDLFDPDWFRPLFLLAWKVFF